MTPSFAQEWSSVCPVIEDEDDPMPPEEDPTPPEGDLFMVTGGQLSLAPPPASSSSSEEEEDGPVVVDASPISSKSMEHEV
mmetsp:Transcript_16057/g.47100  ORF Transcript_16057/g.47100 Transcript_16057/m.47100 type:complete len:81 (-) Transcript_16057:638-880(-)